MASSDSFVTPIRSLCVVVRSGGLFPGSVRRFVDS